MKRTITIEIDDAENVTPEELAKLINEALQERGIGKPASISFEESIGNDEDAADEDEGFSQFGRLIG